MKKVIRVLALSDLHLGELETLLYNSEDEYNLINVTVERISELSQGNKTYGSGVEELILIGDILELSEADEDELAVMPKPFLCLL